MIIQRKTVYLDTLQTLRAFAAINVVVLHAIRTAADYELGLTGLEWLGSWGRSGVDFFFVLSGYLMFHLHGCGGISTRLFAQRRIVRIVPIYWLLTGSYIGILAVFPVLFREAEFDISHIFSSLFFVSNWVKGMYPYIGPGWTLEYEIIFYGIFACTLAVQGLTSIQRLATIAGAIFILVQLTAVGEVAYEFCLGMLAALLRERIACASRQGVLVTCLLLGSILYVGAIWHGQELPRWALYGIPATLIVFALGSLQQLDLPLGRLLGDASYSIYLIQMFTIPFVAKAWDFMGVSRELSSFFVPIVVAVTIIS